MLNDVFSEFGFYRSGGAVFFDKISARASGQRVTYHLNDDAYANAHIEPPESLDEIYRQRAQELRDRFDYLVLMYSGGTDSHQILSICLRHRIHIDEVCTFYPVSFIERVREDAPCGTPYDMLLDYKHLALPGLRAVAKLAPRTRISVVDMTDDYARPWTENWLEKLCPWPKPTSSIYNAIKRNAEADFLQRRADAIFCRGGHIGVVYGVDKPFMRIVDRKLHIFFSDVARVGVHNIFVNDLSPLFTPVMFYWGSPAVVTKQAHIILRAVNKSTAAREHIRRTGCNVYPNTGIPDIDLSLIYPDSFDRHPAKVNSKSTGIISTFIDRPVATFTQMRRRHFEGIFGDRREDDFLSDTHTRLHLIGDVHEEFNDHQLSAGTPARHLPIGYMGARVLNR